MNKPFISPVYNIKRIPLEKIQANVYNPNKVAPSEMKLLYDSIKEDGYTQPIVCYHIKDKDVYELERDERNYFIDIILELKETK